MKIQPAKVPSTFNPVTITLETPQEVAFLHALFNNLVLNGLGLTFGMPEETYEMLRAANEAAGNSAIQSNPIHNAIQAMIRDEYKSQPN